LRYAHARVGELEPAADKMKKNCTRLGYYAASCGNCLPTFRDNLSVPSSRVKSPLFFYFYFYCFIVFIYFLFIFYLFNYLFYFISSFSPFYTFVPLVHFPSLLLLHSIHFSPITLTFLHSAAPGPVFA
jgi:hypothetical protein